MRLDSALTEGFFLQASLITAFGAQNLYVLESGVRKVRPQLVALLSALGDWALIAVGVAGAGSLFVRFLWLKIFFGAVGVLFLAVYGLQKIFRPALDAHREQTSEQGPPTWRSTALQALGFSLLNPHVYLDTVVLIGGFSARYAAFSQRAAFGAGAAAVSALWFFALANAASFAGRWVKDPQRMRALSLWAGGLILYLAWALGRDVATWMGEYRS